MNPADDHGHATDDPYGGSGRTRTRLPGSYDDGLDGNPRRPARPSRSLITVVGIVVLLIAAIAFANQGGGDGDSGGDSGPAGAKNTSPTAPTGTDPVKGRTDGIPTGYARSAQGAQSAAANYTVALGSDGMYDKNRRDRIVQTVYASDIAETRRTDLDKAYSTKDLLSGIGLNPDGTPPEGMTFVSRHNPMGAKAESFNQNEARVSVWYSALFGLAGENSRNPVTESWYTSTLQLRWADGDWKIVNQTQKDGPVPVGRDQTASGSQEMADAVQQFGGFTYAR
ncbi:hypothetical protein [Streptomyces qinzhouensis]|uniref:DUF8175 domain-containing protein n=1 Tax=Streptomyces qinzhouensis TaxID=2599401 RepID=A0A5B8IGI5_9ACTN|nr:hypothetical protein [Streptomyces qinzhouensis]QDY77638.1 hypothetical protein FQU76_15120 [Streptomyces qinzhouensis]